MLNSTHAADGSHLFARAPRRALAKCAVAGLALMLAIQPALAAPFPSSNPAATSAAKRMVAAFEAWAKKNKVKDGSVAVSTGTTLLGSGAVGSYHPASIEPVASESKAITAVCIAKLVDAKKLAFTTQLKTVLKSYFASNAPADSRIPSITIGDLLTHSSGMTTDPSQGGAIEANLPFNQTNLEAQTQISFQTALGKKPGTFYFYNNMNYAVLGFVIETITKETYQTYCSKTVLKPVGVTDAVLNPPWLIMSSWGGWKISAQDYAKFLEYYLPSKHLLKTTPAQWPKFNISGNNYYGLGQIMQKAGSGYNFFHEGSWVWTGSPKASFGGYDTVYQETIRYMTEFSPTVSDSAVTALSTAMSNAYLGKAMRTVAPETRPELITH
jgi:CubicO group peptidase (beta-lactamase class C family)